MKKGAVVLFALIFMLPIFTVSALQEGICVTAEVSDISPTSIKIGEEFTVGILVDNCGDEIPKEVTFELIDVSPNIEVKESLKKDIGEMGYTNSNRFILYHMKVAEDASSGKYKFNYRLNYDYMQSDGSFTITVIGEKAELSIASLKTKPVLPVEGETVELTLRIENTGDGTAKSVSVYANHSFQGLKQSFLGALDSDEDGPAVFTFIVDKAGEFEIPVTISYKDDFGDNEVKKIMNLSVLEKKSNVGAIIFAILMLAVLGIGIYYFIKTKKVKDKIIHQLLKGDNADEKNKKSMRKK